MQGWLDTWHFLTLRLGWMVVDCWLLIIHFHSLVDVLAEMPAAAAAAVLLLVGTRSKLSLIKKATPHQVQKDSRVKWLEIKTLVSASTTVTSKFVCVVCSWVAVSKLGVFVLCFVADDKDNKSFECFDWGGEGRRNGKDPGHCSAYVS